jgi:hypothetical protein
MDTSKLSEPLRRGAGRDYCGAGGADGQERVLTVRILTG